MINPFYSFLYLISGFVSLLIAFIAWNRRPASGAIPLTIMMLSMALWAWGDGGYWMTSTNELKLFFLKVLFTGAIISSPAFTVMTISLAGRNSMLTRKFYAILAVLPVVALFMLWTDWGDGLFFNNIVIANHNDLRGGGIGMQLSFFSGYLNTAFGFIVLVISLFQSGRLRKIQSAFVLFGSSLPVVANILGLANTTVLKDFDLTITAFSFSGLFYVYALYRYQMMDLAPIGRNKVLEEMKDGVLVLDKDSRVVDLNPMARSFVEKGMPNPIGKSFHTAFATWIKTTGLGYNLTNGQYSVQVEGPDFYHYDIYVTPLLDSYGDTAGRLLVWHDISSQKKSEIEVRELNLHLKYKLDEIEQLHEQLREQAIRDELTGLFNRRYMQETLEREVSRASRDNTPLSILMIDVDKFKMVNDTFGHHAGDDVLRALGNILMKHIRTGDAACRYGGDEMLVVMLNAPLEDALRRAKELDNIFSDLAFHFDGATFQTALSIGVATFPIHAKTVSEMLQFADKALYSVKHKHRLEYAQKSVEKKDPYREEAESQKKD